MKHMRPLFFGQLTPLWVCPTDQLNSCDPEGWICYGSCRVSSHNTWLHNVTYGFLNMVNMVTYDYMFFGISTYNRIDTRRMVA